MSCLRLCVKRRYVLMTRTMTATVLRTTAVLKNLSVETAIASSMKISGHVLQTAHVKNLRASLAIGSAPATPFQYAAIMTLTTALSGAGRRDAMKDSAASQDTASVSWNAKHTATKVQESAIPGVIRSAPNRQG